MLKILYFDVCAIIVLIILLASLYFRNMISGRTNKILALLLVDILVSTILDCWAEAYTIWLPAKESNIWFRELLFSAYFLFRNLTTPLYQLFICAITDTWHILVKNKCLKLMLITPYLVVCGLLFTNPFHHMVFYINENLIYTRGPLIYVLYAIAFFYFLYGTVYLFTYKKLLTVDKFIASIIMYPLNIVAVLIQLFFPGCMVEMFMTSLTMLLITLVVQRPEETINPVLGVRSYIAYTLDMKKVFYLHKPVQIIFVKLVNYRALFSLLEFDVGNQLLKRTVAGMMSCYGTEHLPIDLYYLENGLFALVTEKDQTDKLKAVAERIAVMLTKSIKMEQQDIELQLEPCICILRCPQDIKSYDSLLSFGNSFYTYLPAGNIVNDMMEANGQRLFQLRNDIDSILTNAIAERRFQMYYQPIYSIKKQKFLSAEALIRLYDDTYGFISPELFITAAERNGTILQIGDFVLEDVCRFLEKCRNDGLPIEYIEINLSMKQCMQKNLLDKVQYYLEKYHLKPGQINLEITETAANTAQDIVEENIQKLTEMGISFSLDDYGTGYSNISRIMSLPFRIVKLDKSLADKVDDSRMKILLKNTIRMLKETGMEIVVEGVETKESMQKFADLECDFIQGYFFSRPLPEQEFVQFIRESSISR